ncbi:MAG: threo-3-hydroxy-L-aspartate ammonia-lyase [Acidobacteriota bacterium]|nr:threo-3-hydroxy-L-aspartate ammonia-lyase [Acidobacteriota bacterium]
MHIDLAAIRAAAARIAPHIHRTPLLASRSLSERFGVEVRLKCENLQRAGSFKIRGAMNALLQIPEAERWRGVVAFSSGNHAQGVALAAKVLGMPATIVMPENSVQSKVLATEAYGAKVVQAGVTSATRDTVAREIADKTGAAVLPPFDDDRIIAGAGTVGLEIVEEWPEVTTVITPLGGGGLLSGTALAATSLNPSIEVYGVEPAAGNDGEQSFRTGAIVTIDPPNTIADGARTLAIGTRNFAIIRERVRDVVSVDDEVLLETVKWAMYRTKLVIEPTGALGIAALVAGKICPRGAVAIVVSGGNLDFSLLA